MALIENSPSASVLSNPRLPDNPIVAANDASLRLTGYDGDSIVGRNCRFLAGEATGPWLTDHPSSLLSEEYFPRDALFAKIDSRLRSF